jgi:hypothetical protein
MPFRVTFAFISLLGAPAPPGKHLAYKLANLNGDPAMGTGFVTSDRLPSFVRVSQFGHTK